MEGRVLTCVYCGHEYPQETPAWGNDVLTEHIRVCPKHPMRKAEADIALLRGALAGLVGASDKAELDQMELAMRVIPAPEADKIASLNAIHALLATLPNTTERARAGSASPGSAGWRRCEWAESEQYRSRILTGSIGLEGTWDDWEDGRPEKTAMNREYEYRRREHGA